MEFLPVFLFHHFLLKSNFHKLYRSSYTATQDASSLNSCISLFFKKHKNNAFKKYKNNAFKKYKNNALI